MRQRRGADLRVRAADDLVFPEQVEGAHGMVVRALHAAQLVVQLRRAVDGDAARAEPGLLRGADALFVEGQAAALQAGVDAVLGERADDVEPVAAEEGLAADDRHLAHAQPGKLPHHVQALLGGQLRRPGLARPRSAVDALEVAGQRDLPHGGERMTARPVVLGCVAMRQLSRFHRRLLVERGFQLLDGLAEVALFLVMLLRIGQELAHLVLVAALDAVRDYDAVEDDRTPPRITALVTPTARVRHGFSPFDSSNLRVPCAYYRSDGMASIPTLHLYFSMG